MSELVAGISAFYHDSAACVVRDGEIVAAAEEERFSRRKGDARFPEHALRYCLEAAGASPADLTAVAFYDKPVQTFGRLLQSYLEYPLRSFRSFRESFPVFMGEKLRIPRIIDAALPGFGGEIYFTRHHEAHAASAFFCSPFEEAALLVVDGVGEWACTSIGEGRGGSIRLLQEVRFPHSLGLFYSAVTQYLGFKVNEDEYKVMGLAPYGEPRYKDLLLDTLVELKPDGSLALDLRYFPFVHGLRMIEGWEEVFGHAPRAAESKLEEFHMDFAASAQWITTEAMLRLARTAKRLTGHRRLCLAGGVALNCVANGAIHRAGIFDDLYVQPAAGDAGGAIGAALQVVHQVLDRPRRSGHDAMRGACLGPSIQDERVEPFLRSAGADYLRVPREAIADRVAGWLADGLIVGFCQGRMEFGPRSLGARSILGDPRDPANQSRINRKVKYRESFRPFAPAILEERVDELFDLRIPSPYMLLVLPLREEARRNVAENAARPGLEKLAVARSEIPAVTHVDYSVRLQTVTKERNGVFYDVVKAFEARTGCPMVVNTSFNVRGEPIVCDHEDAYRCFRMTDIDVLVLDTCVVAKPGIDLSAPPRNRSGDLPGGSA